MSLLLEKLLRTFNFNQPILKIVITFRCSKLTDSTSNRWDEALVFCNPNLGLPWREKGGRVSWITKFLSLVSRAANFQTLVWDLRLFVILQTFLLLFHICLKPRVFCTSHHKTTSEHPRIQEFCLYFANSVISDKNWKSAPTQLAPSVLGQAYGLRKHVC